MKKEGVEMSVMLVSIKEFLEKYPRFRTLMNNGGEELFNIIVKKEVFIDVSILTKYGYPSVLGVAEECQMIIEKSNQLKADGLTKQFIGAVVCVLMEANGYKKTGVKKSVPHSFFSVGEFYERDLNFQSVE